MHMLSAAALIQARNRLARMVGPVAIRVPDGRTDMWALGEQLVGQLVEGGLLTAEEWEGDRLTLLDGHGRPTGICFLDLPEGQEFSAFVDAILAVSRGSAVLTPLGRQGAAALPEGSALSVLTTPA